MLWYYIVHRFVALNLDSIVGSKRLQGVKLVNELSKTETEK